MPTLQIKACRAARPTVDVVPETDRELVQRFVWDHCELAFEALMRRHGPMVMGVCRRVLSNPQDAEDACQKTFLLFVQKSPAIRRPEQLSSWLFGVAYRVSVRIRANAARRKSAEMQPAVNSFETATDDTTPEAAWRETLSVLDEEISRLPENYRVPLILCYLQGKTHVEVAFELGCPAGSMSTLLTRAREALRRRLAWRGITLSAGLFATLLGRESLAADLPPLLIRTTTRAAMLTARGNVEAPEPNSPPTGKSLPAGKHSMLRPKFRRLAAVAVFLLLFSGVVYRIVTVPGIPEASPAAIKLANPGPVDAVTRFPAARPDLAMVGNRDSDNEPLADQFSEKPSIPGSAPAIGADGSGRQWSVGLFASRQQPEAFTPKQFADFRHEKVSHDTTAPSACLKTCGN